MSRSFLQAKGANYNILFAGIAGIASLLLVYKFAFKSGGKSDTRSVEILKGLDLDVTVEDEDEKDATEKDVAEKDSKTVATSPSKDSVYTSKTETPLHSNRSVEGSSEGGTSDVLMAELHSKIEEIDKRGKSLFKSKKYMDAAEVFSEALDLINSKFEHAEKYGNLNKQLVTLMNNRSAMYEKGGVPDLALVDCEGILEIEPSHTKARTRKLRILETLKRHNDALVEVCALQLKFMQDNRDKLRLGIPVTPPVPQSKIEELMALILPGEIEKTMKELEVKHKGEEKALPSNHTILQLLQSFAGYNKWMAQAAKDGGVDALTAQLDATSKDEDVVEILLKRGRRYAYDRKFDDCKNDFETAYGMLAKDADLKDLLNGDVYARVLEWTGMCRHLRYDLEGALKCYEECSDVDPTNAEILVKRAGVKMDSGKLEEALALFDTALGLDPTAVDALLHRANLRMLEQKPNEAKTDLNRCIELRPNHIFAHLRLATLSMALDDIEGAKSSLEEAERIEPQSSEVHSYRGELFFAQSQMEEAREAFDKAIECDGGNPTPYVNAALAVMNIPSAPGHPPDIPEAIRLLEKAIEVDPQFQTAYVHLGQLKLSMATDLTTARDVIALYDKGLDHCRTPEELKDIVSMRVLTVAQVEAASALKMNTLNMQ